MSSEIFHEPYLDFKYPDEENLNSKIHECLNLVKKINEEKIEYCVVGGLSLILLSKAYYRDPSNIDILVNKKDVKKTIDLIESLGYVCSSPERQKRDFLNYSSNLYRKYAAVNVANCENNEEDADLFFINKGRFDFYNSKNKNSNQTFSLSNFVPLWVHHDPSGYLKKIDEITKSELINSKKQVEIFDNKFIVNFSTSHYMVRDPYGYDFYISFYDQNNKNILNQKCIDLSNSYTPDKIFFSNMCSRVFLLENYKDCSYRIFCERPYFGINFLHPEKPIKLSLNSNDSQMSSKIETSIQNQYIFVSNPLKTMEYKLKKFIKKDYEDYDFHYKYLNTYLDKGLEQ